MQHGKKWVIVFLIYADFRIDEANATTALAMDVKTKVELNRLFKDVLTTPLDADLGRMYVILDGIRYTSDAGMLQVHAQTFLYEIINPYGEPFNKIGHCCIFDKTLTPVGMPLPKQPVSDSGRLAELFGTIPVNDDEVCLITWDHGSAFGIFRESRPSIPSTSSTSSVEPMEPIYEGLEYYPFLKQFWDTASTSPACKGSETLSTNHSGKKTIPLIKVHDVIYKVKSEEANLWAEISGNRTNLHNVPHRDFFRLKTNEDKTRSLEVQKPMGGGFKEVSNRFFAGDANLVEEWAELGKVSQSGVAEILRNDELAEALKAWVGPQKTVSVLLMMNCWMMNLHTLYAMKDCVQCLVAPQGGIDLPGYNYKDILSSVFDKKRYLLTPQQLAQICVETSENSRARKRARKLNIDDPDTIDKWKIIAIELQRENVNGEKLIEVHLNAFQEIINLLTPKSQLNKEAINFYKYIRLCSFDFTENDTFHKGNGSIMVDVVDWLFNLAKINERSQKHIPIINEDSATTIGRFVSDVRSETNLMLAETKATALPSKTGTFLNLSPSGYSLFFPQFPSDNQNLLDNVHRDTLLNDFDTWKKFLQVIYPNLNFFK